MPSKEILLNQIFTGKYLTMGENVGHETINLFKDDEQRFFLYITKSGVVSRKVESVIFIRTFQTQKTVEVIAVARGLNKPTVNLKSIKYAGVSLPDIFKKNVWEDVEEDWMFVTYEADEVLVPADGKRVFITTDEQFKKPEENSEIVYLGSDEQGKFISNSSMRKFYSEKTNATAYARLEELVARKQWVPLEGTLDTDEAPADLSPSFLEVIRKENDELVFSNLLVYYFAYNKAAFKSFAQQVLKIKGMDSPDSFEREHEHIDIYIKSAKHSIVIENKIGSGIKGSAKGNQTQLDDYYSYALTDADERQLHFFIFAPDYKVAELEADAQPNDMRKSEYVIIPYSKIYKYFIANTPVFIADKCFPDFLRGLRRHTVKTINELTLETMRLRFLTRIRNSLS